MKLTSLCYLERDGQYLMLHRTKKENDEKIAKIKADYDKRLDEREKVITQLMNGNANKPTNSIIDNINKKREAQTKKRVSRFSRNSFFWSEAEAGARSSPTAKTCFWGNGRLTELHLKKS